MSKYCTNCGQLIPDNVNFCENCGTRINRSEPQLTYPAQANQQPQQTYQQPYQQYPQQSYAYQTPYAPKKRSCGGTLVKIVLVIALLCALWFGAKTVLEKQGISLPSFTIPGTSSGQGSSGKSSGGGTQRSGGGSGGSSTPGSGTPDGPDVSQGLLSPNGDAWFDDFLFYENDVYYNGIPSEAYLETAGYMSGRWKYCMTFNRTIEGEERMDEVGLAEIVLDGDTATLILHPQYIRYGTDVYPETDAEVGYPDFTGSWDNDYIEVSGGGVTISLGTFYGCNGLEYALGSVIVSKTGMFGDVLLVRP